MLESTDQEKKPTGRPSDYTDELAELICERLILGESMKSICTDDEMPAEGTVYRWLAKREDFREKYRVAREAQAERMLDEILEIADNSADDTLITDFGPRPDMEWIARSKLRVNARQWAMAKLAPKKYGDSKAVDLTSGGQRLSGILIEDVGA